MKKFLSVIGLLSLCLCSNTSLAQASETSVSAGAARGDDSTYVYNINVRQSYEPWLSSSVAELSPNAELGAMLIDHDDDTVGGAYLTPGLRLTLFTMQDFQPFLAGSIGGAALTQRHIDDRKLGSPILFRSQGAIGVTFGSNLNHRIQGEYTNYSTWGITSTNEGYNTYGVSYGYSF